MCTVYQRATYTIDDERNEFERKKKKRICEMEYVADD